MLLAVAIQVPVGVLVLTDPVCYGAIFAAGSLPLIRIVYAISVVNTIALGGLACVAYNKGTIDGQE